MTTCSTRSGSTPERSSAASIAIAPSSVASSDDRPPPILPMGVRAAPRITVLGIEAILLLWICPTHTTEARPEDENASGHAPASATTTATRRALYRDLFQISCRDPW